MTNTPNIPLLSLKKEHSEFPKQRIRSSLEAYEFIKRFYSDDIDIYESFFLLLLNYGGYTIGFAKISQGGITGTIADTRLIAKIALESLAVRVILAHNHPSGVSEPSTADRQLTDTLKQALALVDVRVLDHFIVAGNAQPLSFAERGLL